MWRSCRKSSTAKKKRKQQNKPKTLFELQKWWGTCGATEGFQRVNESRQTQQTRDTSQVERDAADIRTNQNKTSSHLTKVNPFLFSLCVSPANGYISARASPGLLSVSNGNSLGKVVPAKSPPPPSPQMVNSRKPDLRVITSQSGKSLMQLVRKKNI